MGSLSELDNESDSVTRQTEDVREYESLPRDDFIDVEETEDAANDDDINIATLADESGSGTTYALIECSKQRYDKHQEEDVLFEGRGETADEDMIKSTSSSKATPDTKSDSKLKTHFERFSNDAIHSIDAQSLPSTSSTSSVAIDDQKDLTPRTNYGHTSSSLSSELSEILLSTDQQDEEDPVPDLLSSPLEQNIAKGGDKTIVNLNFIKKDVDLFEFPHRAVRVMECQVCFDKKCLRRSMCCDFQMCDDCLLQYISGKVNDGQVQIECGNDRCKVLMYKNEIRYRLPLEMREKFNRFLIDANQDPHIKTCPSCSSPHRIDPARLNVSKKVLKHGVDVACPQCRIVWCFRCHAPFHTNMTCDQYSDEDGMVRRWAKQKNQDGKNNARQCPKCKVFVQKIGGCDHMKCSKCKAQFCYQCGGRYIKIQYVGGHGSWFSILGCKYKMLPKRKALRLLIRGSVFVGQLCAGVVVGGLAVAAGAVLVAGSVVILPGYGVYRWRKRKRDNIRPRPPIIYL